MSQLERLARPFPSRLIHENPSGGGSYVKHSVVTEKLLAVLGPFSFELVQVIRGHVDSVEPNPNGKSAKAKRGSPALEEAVVGAVCRLSAEVDGVAVAVEEVGDCESPHNWPHDGARLKDAMSDALKRAAMRLGVTLHLWSGPEFSLYDQLREQNAEAGHGRSASGTAAAGEGDGQPLSAADAQGSRPSSASAPSSRESNESTTAMNGGEGPSPTASPPISQNQLHRCKAKMKQLLADKVKIADRRIAAGLPLLDGDISQDDLDLWEALLTQIELELAAPFEKASS